MSGDETGSPPQKPRSRLFFWLKLVLAALILGLLIRMAGLGSVVDALRGSQPAWLLLMYMMMLITLTYEGAVMQAILRQAGQTVRLRRVVLAHALARLYSLITPGELVASIAKWKNLSDATGQGPLVLNSIIYYRFVLLISPLIIGASALAISNPFPGVALDLFAWGFTLLLVLGMAFVLHRTTAPLFDAGIAALLQRVPAIVRRPGMKVLAALHALRSMTLGQHAAFMLAGIADFALVMLGFWAAARAMNLELPLVTLVWVQAAILLLRLLPITFANLGVREGLLVFVLALYGVAAGDAIALGLLLFSRYLAIAAIGAVYQYYLLFGPTQDNDLTARVNKP
jgi:glycosyltransferase 2 family protein